ncbi:unnamed protein product [Rangifer tarandus platyrhynchus]|uniref:Uncharacterized protein n=1 Tax=Rangifer tarandus platyrhynchus TaxID=3082113 RepID=A0ABN8ZR03_RANTA|nr:unnamed protein product [Rangifer tarandus platyrhynchus]
MQQCSLGISETLRQGGRCAAGRSQGSGTAARRSLALPSALPAELRAWHGFALGPSRHLHQRLFRSSAKAQPGRGKLEQPLPAPPQRGASAVGLPSVHAALLQNSVQSQRSPRKGDV